ncbi:MAG: zinc protease [Porticoccaceae bacterium]|jgi:zinc protease
MFRTFFSALVLIMILTPTASAAAKLPRGVEQLNSIEGITEYRLKNGLQVLLFPDPSQETITVNITYKVGSKHENYGETGMAHLLEHLVFKGTPRHKNIAKELTDHGAEPNGTTWTDRTNYYETFSATDENLKWALDLEADRMVNSFIAKKDLDSEMTVVRNELENGENSPVGVLIDRMLATSFDWHNYGKSTIGARTDLENVKIENLKAFYKKYYQPDNATLIVSGKIDQDKTIKLVHKYFSKIKRPKRQLQELYTEEPIQDGERQVTIRRAGDVKVVASMYHIPAGFDEMYPAVALLTNILADPTSGRLHKTLVKNNLAANSYGFSFQWGEPGVAIFMAQLGVDKDIEPARVAMLETLENLTDEPISDEEVARAKAKMIKQFELRFNSSQSIALELSEWIGMGDWRLMFIDRDRMEQVTADKVRSAAAEYLVNDNRTLGLFLPEQNPDRADSIVRLQQSDVDQLVADYQGRESVAQGEDFDPSHDNIDARTITRQLDNGSTVVYLPKKTRGESVVASINLDFGNEADLFEQSVIGNMTVSMLDRGTQKYSREELQAAFDELKASVSVSGGSTGAGAGILTTKKNLAAVMELTEEIFKHPTFDSEELKVLKEEMIVGLEQEKQQPTSRVFRELGNHLNPYSPGHPYYQISIDDEIAQIRSVTSKDLYAFHTRFIGGQDAEASVVGDFDIDEINTQLNKMMAGWSSNTVYERIESRVADTNSINRFIDTPDKSGAAFGAMIKFKLRDDHPDYPALEMANQMFGGGFISSRLANRLRQQDGLSYGAGSWFNASSYDENATFGAYAICAPENLARVEVGFKEELAKVLDKGFTQQELNDARTGILQNSRIDRAKDGRLVRTLSGNIDLNRTMQWDKNYEKAVMDLSVEDVNTAVKRHLSMEGISIIKAGDSEKITSLIEASEQG